MAWLQQLSGTYHISFRFGGQKFKRSLRTSKPKEAEARLERLKENIRLVEAGRIDLPAHSDIPTFLLSDGKLNGKPKVKSKLRTFAQFSKAFFNSIPNGSLEEDTLKCMRTHIDHLTRVIGKTFVLPELSLEDLQGYVEDRSQDKGRRGKQLSSTTIKKEISTLKTLWRWAQNAKHVTDNFPSKGLRYPKTSEKPPFQTWAEITRKIETFALNEDEQADLWECLFLTMTELESLLSEVKQQANHNYLYPMFVFAAHTGARRSEILRSQVEDIDFSGNAITIREKKRVQGRLTTRTVPISPMLHSVLQDWLAHHSGRGATFSLDYRRRGIWAPITKSEANNHFKSTLAGTKWSTIRGWHVFRHSFCSNCAAAGIDQRVINAWVGHQTEEMVKRYRHLIPNQQQAAITRVFQLPTAGNAVSVE